MLTKEERAEMRERAESATAGPWMEQRWGRTAVRLLTPDGKEACRVYDEPRDANATFIAAARTDVIALLDALDGSEKQVREWVAVSARRRAEAKEAGDATMDKWYGGMADAFGIVLRLLETRQEQEVPQ